MFTLVNSTLKNHFYYCCSGAIGLLCLINTTNLNYQILLTVMDCNAGCMDLRAKKLTVKYLKPKTHYQPNWKYMEI
jgi:hypothetical protein